MKPFNFKRLDKKIDTSTLRMGINIFILIAALILFEKISGNLPILGSSFKTALLYILGLFSPFILGFAFAYLMNPMVKFMEKKVFQYAPKATSKRKLVRALAIIVNYIIVIGGITWITIYLIPEVRDSIMAFFSQLPTYSQQLNLSIEKLFLRTDWIDGSTVNEFLNSLLIPLQEFSTDLPSRLSDLPKLIGDIAGNLFIIGRKTIDLIMAVFIAFYMLYDKEAFVKQLTKLIYALASEERAEQIFYNGARINHIFQTFIVGKALDSFIIGILAFIGLSILNAPFPLILSLIVGVTNMIPYFGPIIGAIPATIITLLISPLTALWVVLFILALQQFDGNYLGPKILGDSLDVSPVLIILAVVLGGALLGPIGMFIGVPILATFKMFFGEFVSRKYNEKYAEHDPMNILNSDEDALNPSQIDSNQN